MIKEWWKKRREQDKLNEVFDKSGLYVEHYTRGGTIKVYPKVNDVIEGKDVTKYIFTIPTGLDPELIRKKMFCFQQVLGTNIYIEGHIKRFVVDVYKNNKGLEQYDYFYEDWEKIIKRYKIPVVVGRNQFGDKIVYDMVGSNTPHLLIAGETGSGKSSMVRVILTTLIKTLKPEELQLYLGDLKNSEFHFLRRVKHVKEVCMEEVEMKNMLSRLWNEVRERRKLMEEYEVDHIDEYNKSSKDKKPYILIAIDEVAMLQGEKECMGLVEKISAVGRALGVFLMLSMQRPDAKVLDGKLKLNMTVRMGFKCDSIINSQIIGTIGSENLKQSGQMIFKLNGLEKVQSPFLKLEDAKRLVGEFREEKKEIIESIIEEEKPLFGVLDDEG
ncbi:FtsK/SpoIIIE-like protein [Bacillus phage DLc1]|uniref:FtsK domain-containing protein n=1 Tax=Bacillus phage DLc1 TaxID=2777318 RepID=A0A7M1RR88_9CAUD|nr:FtsK/SpoIIIE-like protein [Bacillus phage DLc1]QOR56292.1 hypothetical protein [Bacillus phage DLc1]